MNTVSLLLLYTTYEMKIIITYYQISFEIFMLSILHILYMDPHVSKYIIYYFGTTVNWLLKLSSEIVFQFITVLQAICLIERVTVQMTTLYEYLRVFDQRIFFDQKNISQKNLDWEHKKFLTENF